MTTKALSLVEEFIRSREPQIRKNALTALAVINEPEAIELMTNVALKDADAGVRQRAEDELVELNSLDGAIGLARSTLRTADEETQQRAYAFLGRLRSKSAAVSSGFIPWRRLLKLAARMNAYLYPKRTWRFRLRLWKAALAGLLFGSVFPIVFALWHYKDPYNSWVDRLAPISFWWAVIVLTGIVLILVAGHRTTPIYRHPNRFVAGVVETVMTGFLGFASVIPILVLVLVFRLLVTETGSSLGLLFIPLAGLMVGFVRAGTILTFGLSSNRRANRTVQVLGGTAIGSLTFMVATFLMYVASEWPHPAFPWLVAAWIAHLPIAFGAANAFATVDKEALPAYSLVLLDRWRGLRVLIFLSALVFSVALNITTVRFMASRLDRYRMPTTGDITP